MVVKLPTRINWKQLEKDQNEGLPIFSSDIIGVIKIEALKKVKLHIANKIRAPHRSLIIYLAFLQASLRKDEVYEETFASLILATGLTPREFKEAILQLEELKVIELKDECGVTSYTCVEDIVIDS